MYRFSTSWARILPQGFGAPNVEGLDFYDRLVDGILKRGLEPHATLYHWDLPAALATQGGWQNRDIAQRFADYAQVVMDRIGDRTSSVATINEPWCVAWLSHFMGHHAPGLRDIRAAAHAMHHVLLAHGMATQAMRSGGVENIGLVTNFEYVEVADDTKASKYAASLYDGLYNRWFVEAVFKKQYPPEVIDGLSEHMPENYDADFDTIAQPVDWMGINYYTRKIIAHDGTDQFPFAREMEGPLPKTQMGWEIYPEGLYHFITWLHENYTDGLPIVITENGMASADTPLDGRVDDSQRSVYLDLHLGQVKKAIEKGVPVEGYMIWSLLDNFEWALGYEKRFGLVHVDFETLKRTPKQSWFALQNSMKL